MTQKRLHIVHLSAAQVSAGPWSIDNRWGNDSRSRSISGSCGGSDTLTVLVSPIPINADPQNMPLSELGTGYTSIGDHTDFWTTVSVYSATFSDNVAGDWAKYKLVKTGSSAAAHFYIYV